MPDKIWQDQEAIFLKKWYKDVFITQKKDFFCFAFFVFCFFSSFTHKYRIEIIGMLLHVYIVETLAYSRPYS